MSNMRKFLCLFLLLFQTVSYASPSAPLGETEFLSPDDAFKISFSYPSDNQLIVTWDIEKDYYLYVGMINFSLINMGCSLAWILIIPSTTILFNINSFSDRLFNFPPMGRKIIFAKNTP